MKKLLIFLLTVISIAAFGQAGSLSQSVYRSRVNDSTSVTTPAGYGLLYYNNQRATPAWLYSNDQGATWHEFGTGSGGAVDISDVTGLGTNVETALGIAAGAAGGFWRDTDFMTSRTVTSSTATVQADNFNVIYFNSATPVNLTLDALTANTEILIINKGAGLVSIVNGTATGTGAVTIATDEAVALIYETSTSVLVRSGSGVEASPTVRGVAKLYTSTGSNTDGSMDQNSITSGLNGKQSLSGASLLTGARSLSSNTANQETVAGAFTTTSNNQWHSQRASTITLGSSVGWEAYDLDFSNTFVRTNTGQSAASIRINPTFSGAFTSPLSILFGSATTSTNAAYIYNVTGETGFLTNSNGNLVFGGGGKRMWLGKAGNIELSGSTPTEPTFSFTVNQSPTFSTTVLGGAIYTKQSIGNAAPATGGKFYGIFNAGICQSNWVNNAFFYGNSVTNDWSPSGSSSTYAAFHAFPVVNASGGTTTVYSFLADISKLSMTGVTEYSIASASTTARGGVGTATPHSSWQVNGSFAPGFVQKSAAYTLTLADHSVEVISGTHNQTLPTAVGIVGRQYFITNTGAGVVTVNTTSSQAFLNISGTPTTYVLNQFQGVLFVSNGAGWLKMSSF